MTRNTAREIAAHLSYELSFTDKTVDELLKERLTPEAFAELAGGFPLWCYHPAVTTREPVLPSVVRNIPYK